MSTWRPSSARSIWLGLSIGAASTVFCATVALAQTQSQPSRPAQGVYGGAGQTPRDRVAATVSVYGAEDSQLSGDSTGAIDGVPVGQVYSGADIGLSYIPSRRGGVDFDFRGSSGVRYYPDLSNVSASTQSASAGVGILLTRRTALQMRGGLSYQPYLDFAQPVGLEENVPVSPERVRDNRVSTREILSYDGSVNYTYVPSNRTSMAFVYGLRRTQLIDESQSSLDSTIGASFSRRLSRASSARVNYTFRDGGYRLDAETTPIRLHDIEFGYDLALAHSPTKRTTISFSGGPSIVDFQGRQAVRAFGGVTLVHPFNRSWNIRGFYRRGVTFLDGTNQPFLSNSMSIGLAGLVTNRLDVSVSAGAILGDIGFEGGIGASATPYDTYTGSSRVRFGLTNSIALFGEYLATYSKFNNLVGPAPGLNRGGLRFGLNLYVPIVRDPPPAPGARGGARR